MKNTLTPTLFFISVFAGFYTLLNALCAVVAERKRGVTGKISANLITCTHTLIIQCHLIKIVGNLFCTIYNEISDEQCILSRVEPSGPPYIYNIQTKLDFSCFIILNNKI